MMPSFNAISTRYTQYIISSRKNINSASNVAVNYSRYCHVSLLTLRYHWQAMIISFLLEMVIAKDH